MRNNTMKIYINFTRFTIDLSNRTTSLKNNSLTFTEQEWLLLSCLAKAHGDKVTNEDIMLAVWQTQYKTDTVVRQLVKSVRDKIMQYETNVPIQNVRGKGYLLSATVSHSPSPVGSKTKRSSLLFIAASILIVTTVFIYRVIPPSWVTPQKFLEVSDVSEYNLDIGNAIRVHVSNDEKFSLVEQLNVGDVNNTILLYDNLTKKLISQLQGVRPTWSPNNENFAYVVREYSINEKTGVGYTECEIFLGDTDTDVSPAKFLLPCDFSVDPTTYPTDAPHRYVISDDTQIVHIIPANWADNEFIRSKKFQGFSSTLQGNFDAFLDTIFATQNKDVYISMNQEGEVRKHNVQTKENTLIGHTPGVGTKATTINNHFIFTNDKNGLDQIDILSGEMSSLLDPQPEKISDLTSNDSALYITMGEPSTNSVYRLNKNFKPVGKPLGKEAKYIQGTADGLYFLSYVGQTWRLFVHKDGKSEEIFDTRNSTAPLSMAVYDENTFAIAITDNLITKNKIINVPQIWENLRFFDKEHVVFDKEFFLFEEGELRLHSMQMIKANLITGEENVLTKIKSQYSGKVLSFCDRGNPLPWKNGVIATRSQTPSIFFQPEGGELEKISDEVNAPLHTNSWDIHNDLLYYADRSTRQIKVFDMNSHETKEVGVLSTGMFSQFNGDFYGLIPTKQRTRVLKVEVSLDD